MVAILRVLWLFSSLCFLASDAFCYLKMPNSFELLDYTITKKLFFYIMIGLFASFNLIILLVIKTLYLVSPSIILIPRKKIWLQKAKSKALFLKWLELFFKGFIILINIFLALSVIWFLLHHLQWDAEFRQQSDLVLTISLIWIGFLTLGWFFYIGFKLFFLSKHS